MLRSILSHAGKIPGLGREQLGQSCWEGAEAVVTSGREDSLISVWAAVAPLPIRSKLHASLSATTPVSSLQPPLTRAPPLSSSPFEWPLNRHHYSDYYCLSGWCAQNKALACSGVALFWFLCFVSVHGFVMDVTRRPINCVLTGLLGRMLQWTMSSKWDHTYATPLI